MSPPLVDEYVAPVEALLDRTATYYDASGPSRAPTLRTARALWICACATEGDAPTWLVHQVADGLAWCRVPDELDIGDLVVADRWAGGHTDPGTVLSWLEGRWDDPGVSTAGATRAWSSSSDAPCAVSERPCWAHDLRHRSLEARR